MELNKNSITKTFKNLENFQTVPKFFECVADDVDWTVKGIYAQGK